MKKNNGFARLFKNNKFLLVLSLLISIAIWITMSLSGTYDITKTISDIPIKFDFSNDDFQAFMSNEQKATVTVTGNRMSVGSISKDDIVVSAPDASSITHAGQYDFYLTAKKANPSDRFDIVANSVLPSNVTQVFVDKYKESNFDISNIDEVNKINYSVSDGYQAIITTSVNSIKVSGPQTEVEKVASIGITGDISGELKNDTSLECGVKLYDESGSTVTSNFLELDNETVTVKFTVLPYKEVPVSIAYKNKPSGLSMSDYASIKPETLQIAGPEDVLKNLTIKTEPIDFSKLENKDYKDYDDFDEIGLVIPNDCTNMSEESDTAEVKINLSSFSKRKLKVSSDYFTVSGLSDEYTYSITTNSLNVTLIGPKSELNSITEADLKCEIDASSVEGTTGSITLPIKFTVNGDTSCWATGQYKVYISVKK